MVYNKKTKKVVQIVGIIMIIAMLITVVGPVLFTLR